MFWYQESIFVKNAFLYNCRDNDLQRRRNSWIKEGQIVNGEVGYVIAEHNVPGLTGKIVHFKQNRKCRWQGLDLRCMAHKDIPIGSVTKSSLRHLHHAVAQLPDEEAVKIANENEVPVIVTLDGKFYVNLELSTFERQGKGNSRRAKLI
jgi:hypothetical protein